MVSVDADRARLAWWVVGGLLAGAVLLVVHSFLGTIVFGVFVYYATRPLYRRVRRVVRPPSLAAATSLCLLALPVLALLTYAAAIVLREVARFTRSADLGPYEPLVEPYLDLAAVTEPAELLADPSLRRTANAVLDGALESLGVVGTGLLHLFVVFAVAFYLLRDGPRLSRWVRARFADDRGVLDSYLAAVDADLATAFSGTLLNALVTAAVGAIAYSVLDLFAPAGIELVSPALVGGLVGAASLVPLVGAKLVYGPASAYLLYAWATTGDAAASTLWFPVAFAAVSFVVVDVGPDLALRPVDPGGDSHVGTGVVAYVVGPLLFGWYGVFLAPLLLVAGVQFARIVLPDLLGDGTAEPVEPAAVDPPYLDVEQTADASTATSDAPPGTDPDADLPSD